MSLIKIFGKLIRCCMYVIYYWSNGFTFFTYFYQGIKFWCHASYLYKVFLLVFPTVVLHLCTGCWTCFWNVSVGSPFSSIIRFSCVKVSINNDTRHTTPHTHTQTQYIPSKHESSINIRVSPSLNIHKYILHVRDITIIHLLMKSIFITDCMHGHHTEWLPKNCKKIISPHFIVNRTILMF